MKNKKSTIKSNITPNISIIKNIIEEPSWLKQLYDKTLIMSNEHTNYLKYLEKLNNKVEKTSEGRVYKRYPSNRKMIKVVGLRNIQKRFHNLYSKEYDLSVKQTFLDIPQMLSRINSIKKKNRTYSLLYNHKFFYLYNPLLSDIEIHIFQDYVPQSLTLNDYCLTNICKKNILTILVQGLYHIENLAFHNLYHNDLHSTNILITNSNNYPEKQEYKLKRFSNLKEFNFFFANNYPYVTIIDYTLMTCNSYRNGVYENIPINNIKDKESGILFDFAHYCLSVTSSVYSKYSQLLQEPHSSNNKANIQKYLEIITMLNTITSTFTNFFFKTRCSRYYIHINKDACLEDIYIVLHKHYKNIFKHN